MKADEEGNRLGKNKKSTSLSKRNSVSIFL